MLQEIILFVGLFELLGYILERGSIGVTFGERGGELGGELGSFDLEAFILRALLCQDGCLPGHIMRRGKRIENLQKRTLSSI